jgi:carbonic anhydrase
MNACMRKHTYTHPHTHTRTYLVLHHHHCGGVDGNVLGASRYQDLQSVNSCEAHFSYMQRVNSCEIPDHICYVSTVVRSQIRLAMCQQL